MSDKPTRPNIPDSLTQSSMSDKPTIYYSIDPSINPSRWPGAKPGSSIAVNKVDVWYTNVSANSDFRMLHSGTNESIDHAVTQVTHIARGLYRLVSLNASEYSCVVVMSTDKPRDELMWKNGFPWDCDDDPQPEVVLK